MKLFFSERAQPSAGFGTSLKDEVNWAEGLDVLKCRRGRSKRCCTGKREEKEEKEVSLMTSGVLHPTFRVCLGSEVVSKQQQVQNKKFRINCVIQAVNYWV